MLKMCGKKVSIKYKYNCGMDRDKILLLKSITLAIVEQYCKLVQNIEVNMKRNPQ